MQIVAHRAGLAAARVCARRCCATPLVVSVTGHEATVEQADLGAGEEDDGGPFPAEPLRTLGRVYKELHQLV